MHVPRKCITLCMSLENAACSENVALCIWEWSEQALLLV